MNLFLTFLYILPDFFFAIISYNPPFSTRFLHLYPTILHILPDLFTFLSHNPPFLHFYPPLSTSFLAALAALYHIPYQTISSHIKPTMVTKVHNRSHISQMQANFTILTKCHKFDQISIRRQYKTMQTMKTLRTIQIKRTIQTIQNMQTMQTIQTMQTTCTIQTHWKNLDNLDLLYNKAFLSIKPSFAHRAASQSLRSLHYISCNFYHNNKQ